MNKIVVGISGGIDSAVTAAIFREQGYDVLGLHLIVNKDQEDVSHYLDQISSTLGINIKSIDVQKSFNEKIIRYFRNEHLNGHSPSPCAICNPEFKWKHLNEYAEMMGATKIASGHYITKMRKGSKWFLKKGKDENKDQSYFLWGLSQEILHKLTTPLGKINKSKTRELAEKYSLNFLKKKKESTGLCFAGGMDYPGLIKKYIPEVNEIHHGQIIDAEGNIIGTHKGYIYYTIGQKRDLDLPDNKGYCVIRIDAKNNRLVAGKPEDLWKKSFEIHSYNFVDEQLAFNSRELTVKVRGFGWNPDGYCRLTILDHQTLRVHLDNPAWAPAPGQPAVFYLENLLVGGGIIL